MLVICSRNHLPPLLVADVGSCGRGEVSPDDTIRTLTKLFGYDIALINSKVLIEDLEGLAAAHGSVKVC